jgi:putative ABC transport system ATP-binding protein
VTALVLEAEGLVRRFAGSGGKDSFTLVVDELRLRPAVCAAAIGPSGCGKSTLLGLLALALKPDSSKSFVCCGQDVGALWRARQLDRLTQTRASHIGFVPQTGNLLPFLTLEQNIALPQRITGRYDRDWLITLSERLGIAHLLRRRPSELSVGQRQRAAVVRALINRPALVLADEPTASVHPAQASEILSLLMEIAGINETALLITTHDAARAGAAGFAICPCETNDQSDVTRFRLVA